MIHLVGTRCVVRSWRATDGDSIARHANNINVASQLRDRFPHPYTLADAQAFLQMAASAGDSAALLAIDVEQRAVGGIGITIGTDVERYSAELGYWLGEAYWGRGIVSEAVTLLTTYAFVHLNLLRLFAVPFADNAASARVLEKAAYVREGVLRSSSVKYGQPRDQYLYARVNVGWQGPQTAPADCPPSASSAPAPSTLHPYLD